MLEVKGCIVTIDAMGTQTKIARKVVEQEADYALALKGNHERLHSEVREIFDDAHRRNFHDIVHEHHRTVDRNHGGEEIREYWTISDPEFIGYLDTEGEWNVCRVLGW